MAGGAAAGAAIGTAVPGVGTAVGAGVGALVDGLFSFFSGKSQGNATKDAAKMSSASADKALAEQRRIFDLQRSDRQPYVDVSLGALGNLKNLAAQPQYMQLPAQKLGASSPTMPRQAAPMAPMPTGALGQLGQAQPAAAASQAMGLFQAPGPDGETREFPLSMEPQLIAKGARRVK